MHILAKTIRRVHRMSVLPTKHCNHRSFLFSVFISLQLSVKAPNFSSEPWKSVQVISQNHFTDNKMTLAFRTIFINQNCTSSRLLFSRTHFLKSLKSSFPHPNSTTHLPDYRVFTSQTRLLTATKVKASFDEPYGASRNDAYENNSIDIDVFLSTLEFLSLVSSAGVAVFIAVRCGIQKGGAMGRLGSKILMWQCVVLVAGLVAGAVIRRRQWRRISGAGLSRGPTSSGANLLERVEKLEEDLRSSTKIVQALSRQLEKLGIRFRVTRKALKDPIAETAALVQKNSEATRVLAAQEDNLEKELGEIQKVLLAMQEQQQKQLELILAIGKAGKLLEPKHVRSQDVGKASKSSNSSPLARQKETNNDRP